MKQLALSLFARTLQKFFLHLLDMGQNDTVSALSSQAVICIYVHHEYSYFQMYFDRGN